MATTKANTTAKKSQKKVDAKTYPLWLGKLNQRQEALRRAHGLFPGKDGWYKTVALKKRYIAKPMSLDDVLLVLDAKLAEIKGEIAERPTNLSQTSTSIQQLVEIFLAHLWDRHVTGAPRKLSRRTYDDYIDTLSRLVDCVGPAVIASGANPAWFSKFARTIRKKAVSSRRRDIIYIQAFFNWAGPGRHAQNFYRNPVNFGPDLVKPDESQMRSAMAESSTLYSAKDFFKSLMRVRECPLLFAMGLLGLNGAYLPSDLTAIPLKAIDLESGIAEFLRPKTGIQRKTFLMPETVKALRDYLKVRPAPVDGSESLFLREDGRSFNQRRDVGPGFQSYHGNSIGAYWRLVTGYPIKGLRTTFATLGDGFEDQAAVDLVMGHASKSIRQKHYVKHFEPERLRLLVEHVWRQAVVAIPLPTGEVVEASELSRRAARRTSKSASCPTPSEESGNEDV